MVGQLIHSIVGSLVVVSNLITALWLFLRHRRGEGINPLVALSLNTARGSLIAQVVLGMILIGGGGISTPLHFVFAFASIFATWRAFIQSRTSQAPLLTLAFGCLMSGIAALISYLAALNGQNSSP